MKNFLKTIDWKWVGISYATMAVVFGVVALALDSFQYFIQAMMYFGAFILFLLMLQAIDHLSKKQKF